MSKRAISLVTMTPTFNLQEATKADIYTVLFWESHELS